MSDAGTHDWDACGRPVTSISCCFSTRQPGDWGPRRISEDELRTAFGSGWRIESLAAERFDINPGLGILSAEAWLVDVDRVAEGR